VEIEFPSVKSRLFKLN